MLPRVFNEAFIHSRLWWPDIVIVAVGAVILTISFVRSEQRPYLPSALLTYGLLLPLSAAGFGLGSGVGIDEIWPQSLYVFIVHFSWAILFCLFSLFFLRFYPTSAGGLFFTGLVLILLIGVIVYLTGLGRWTMEKISLLQKMEKAGPQVCFNQKEQLRPDLSNDFLRGPPEIKRHYPDFFHMHRQFPASYFLSLGCRHGEDDLL